MRYLRMLSNSMAAAALATSYVIALVLHLNPNLPLHPTRLAPLLATVGLYYVVHLTVIFYILLVVWQLLARELFSPAWLSVNVLTWLGAMAGQRLFSPPNVAGWDDTRWLDTATWRGRWWIATYVLKPYALDPVEFTTRPLTPADPNLGTRNVNES